MSGSTDKTRRADAPSRARIAIIAALLFSGTVLIFARATQFGFLNYDDPYYVTDNPHVQAGLSWDGVVWAFTAPTNYWHPLTWLSHMIDWQLYGSAASGHHLTSVLWHALNAVLAFLVFRRLAGGVGLSAFAAALFAWHPLRVESVAWVTERKDVMSGCFFLLTLLAYARYVDRRSTGAPATRTYLLTLGCFTVGLMSKPMLVTVPLVLLVLDFWPFARASSLASWRVLLLEKLPFFALSGAASVATVLMQKRDGAFVLDLPLDARLGNAVVSLARYLGKFVWPADLIVCYPHPGYWPALAVLGASGLAVGLSWLAWRQRQARPWLAAGWLWFVIVLLPVIGLIQTGFQAMADRYTYLSLLGIELAALWSLAPVVNSPLRRTIAAGLAVAALGACAIRTWDQQRVWRDSLALFEHAVTTSPDNPIAEDFLASALFAARRMDEAAVHAERALALNPRNPTPAINLAAIRDFQGRRGEARELYYRALALRPDDANIQCQLGLLELNSGRLEEARKLMAPPLRENTALRQRTLEIGRSALHNGNRPSARFLFELVLASAPDDASGHAAMADLLLAENDPAAAIVHSRIATEKAPDSADAQLGLARCAELLGKTAEATAALARALEAAPNDALIHAGVAEIHAHRRDFAPAARLYRKAVELSPNDAGIHAGLGYALLLSGDRANGLAAWRRALELNPTMPGLREQLQRQEQRP